MEHIMMMMMMVMMVMMMMIFFWKNVQIINPIPRVPGSKMEQRINGSPCSLTRSQWELGIEFPSRMRAKRIFGFLDNDG
jgi:nitrate/nitrite-specific signal transduction histidine kinase